MLLPKYLNLFRLIEHFTFSIGGGGGGSSAPTSQTVTQTTIPDYARPYAETMLGKTAALTDINQNPYQPYQGQQVADLSQLQQQAMGSIGGQQIASQLGGATNLATAAGMGGLAAQQNAMGLQGAALGYGAQAAAMAPQAQQYGAQAANIGQAGMGYGAQGANIGQRGVSAAEQGFGAGEAYRQQATSADAMGQYMSPYMQNVVAQQQKDAIRQADIARQGSQAAAVKSGAFGGSRSAIVEAEGQRGLQDRLAQIQATGSQSAFDRAQQAQQFASTTGIQGLQAGYQGLQTGMQGTAQGIQGAQVGIQGQQAGMQGLGQAGQLYGLGLQGVQAATGAGQYGLQGLGAAGSAASTLGALGQTQFGQEQAINQAQMQAGALQQAQEQRGLDVAYQQYQDQLNYPYKQLAFQSDMFRGLPLSQSASTMYQNTGAMAPQLVGAGIAAYGASQRAKEGGLVKGYAEGGTTTVDPSVPSSIGPQALSSRLAKLSDEQLMAYARTVKDAVALAEVKGEIQRRQEARAPQGQMPTGTVAQSMMPQEAPEMPVMAGGGIVALNRGGNEKSEFRQDAAADYAREAEKRERQVASAPDALAASGFGYFLNSPDERAAARMRLGELRTAPISEVREFKKTGIPNFPTNNPDPYGTPEQMDAFRRSNIDESARRTIQEFNPTEDYELPQPAPRAAPQATEFSEEGASPVTGTAPSSAPPGTVPGGIVPSRAPVAVAPAGQTPAGQAPAGQAPAAPPASTGIVPSSRAPAAMAGGAVPIANPGDPMGWGAYKANVDDMAKLDPEQKAVLDDMRKRTERRMSRAEKQEKGIMNDAMIAGGLAMMGGLNLSDGVRRLATIGGQKYFESSSEARKAIDKADDAQDAFNQYQLSLKQGNKKVAADMYGKYFNTMVDLQGKIQAASISAGASREATAENRASREQQAQLNREQQAFQNSEAIRIREAQIEQNQQQFVERMTAQGETQKANDFYRLQTLKQDALGKVDAARRNVFTAAERDPMYMQLYSIPENKLTPDQKKQKNVLDARIAKNLADATKPFMDEIGTIVNRQSTMMGLSPVSGGNVPTYDPRTGTFK